MGPLYNLVHTHTEVPRIPWSATVGFQLSGIVTAVAIRVKLLLCCLAVQLSGQQKSTDKHTHLHIHKSTQMHTDTHGNTKLIQRIQNKLWSKPQKPDPRMYLFPHVCIHAFSMNAGNRNICAQAKRIISGVKFTHPPTQTLFHTTSNMLSGVITLTHI